MLNQHPITPPPELVAKWASSMCGYYEAARWGADQELEACCQALRVRGTRMRCMEANQTIEHLRAARRPKPSLKEQALAVLDHTQKGYGLAEVDLDTIRRALEALDD
jgi:hypothetical protein